MAMDRRRALSAAGLSGAAALVAAAGGASWYYARRLVEPAADVKPEPPPAEDHVMIAGVAEGTIELDGPGAERRGTWGLTWPDGYARVGPVTNAHDGRIERPLTSFIGTAMAGETAVLDAHAYPPDPDVLGLPWRDTTYQSPVGTLPAWEFLGDRDTWAIFVHGRSAQRHEAFRAIPTFAERGFPCLAISYRNDAGAPRSPDGRCHLGWTEWEDVEGAVIYALSQGARDVVLVGYSMGGACVVNFLRVSAHAERVRAVVLEAPVLDWGPTIRRAALQRGLPPAVLPMLVPTSMAVARMQAGIDWRSMRHIDEPKSLKQPTLLIHGDADPLVPVELADAFAAARPDIITYLRVPGAAHVRAWNADRTAYESTLAMFLDEHAGRPAPKGRRRLRGGNGA